MRLLCLQGLLSILLLVLALSTVSADEGPAMLPVFGQYKKCVTPSQCGYKFLDDATYTRPDQTTYTIKHPAWDLNLVQGDDGVPVYAIADGIVYLDESNVVPDQSGKAKYISTYWGVLLIEHNIDGVICYSQYGHVDSIFVANGQFVKKGNKIATISDVGSPANYHLHWEIRSNSHESRTDPGYWSSTLLADANNVSSWYREPEVFVAELNINHEASGNGLLGDEDGQIYWWYGDGHGSSSDLYLTDGTSKQCIIQDYIDDILGDCAIVFDALGGSRQAYTVHTNFWNSTQGNGWSQLNPAGPQSELGMPVTNAYRLIDTPESWRQDFQKGYIKDGAVLGYGVSAPGWTATAWNIQYSYLFVDAYDRNGAARDVGEATETVVEGWNGTAYAVQHFGDDRMIVYDPDNYVGNPATTNEAYYIYGDFYHYYTTEPAVGPWILGAPTTDRWGNVQYFRSGRMEDDNGIIRAYNRDDSVEFWSSSGTVYLAFSDDFEDGDDIGWDIHGLGIWSVQNGSYVLEFSSLNQSGKALAGNLDWTDYTIDVDIRGVAGLDKQVWIREAQDCNTYAVIFKSDPTNTVRLVKYVDCLEQWRITAPLPFPMYNEEWYHVTVSAIQDRIQVYFDTELMIDFTDEGTAITHGRMCLGGGNGTDDYRTEFDNVRVTGPSDILPSIYLACPNDGGFLRGGSPAGINWQCWGPNVDHIRIQYSDDNGATFSDLAMVANSGHYDWNVPDVAVQDAIIRVQAEAANNTVLAHDQSEKSFPIMPYYLAFFDDFEDGNADGWDIHGLGIWSVQNGSYVLEFSSLNQSGKALAGNLDWTDYTIDVDIRGVAGLDKQVWIREAQDCNTYAVIFKSDPTNTVRLVKYVDCLEQWRITNPLPFPMYNEEWYHVTVSAIQDRIQVYFDTELMIDFTDEGTAITHGRMCLGGGNGTDDYRTEFDNVRVTGPASMLLPETQEMLPGDYDTELAEVDDISAGDSDIREILIDYVSRAWRVILNWHGSELRLSVYRPDGTIYGEWQSTEPPIIAEFIPDTTSTWQFEVTAIDIPYDNYPYALVVGSQPLGSLSGTVADSSGIAMYGVPIDLYEDATNALLVSEIADSTGSFSVPDLIPGIYNVSITTPLGYQADAEAKLITVTGGADSAVSFVLSQLDIVPAQRSRGYWKHEIGHIIKNMEKNKDKPTDYTVDDFTDFLALTESHFAQNQVNPMLIYEGSAALTQLDSLKLLKDLLSAKKSNDNDENKKLRKAKAEFMTLILNVVSSKIAQAEIISDDSANVSQAITYSWMLLTEQITCTDQDDDDDEDRDEDECVCNYKKAKKILKKINHGKMVKSGVVPLNIDFIAYKSGDQANLPAEFALSQNYPNPFNPQTTISYALPEAAHIRIDIFNVLGQRVTNLVNRDQDAGNYSVTWDAREHASGIYLYRIATGAFVETKKMLLLK